MINKQKLIIASPGIRDGYRTTDGLKMNRNYKIESKWDYYTLEPKNLLKIKTTCYKRKLNHVKNIKISVNKRTRQFILKIILLLNRRENIRNK